MPPWKIPSLASSKNFQTSAFRLKRLPAGILCLTSGLYIFATKSALCFTNGKGATKKAALASALGEYFWSVSQPTTFADFWLGETIANGPFVHYPNEKWFPLTENDDVPEGLLDDRLRAFYDPENELTGSMLIDLQSGNEDRYLRPAVYASVRQSDRLYSDEYHR